MSEKKGSAKISKLASTLDYAEWKRSMKAYLRVNDYIQNRLQKSPQNSNEEPNKDWNEAQIIAKCNIILYLAPKPQIRTRDIIDDDYKTA